MNVLPPSPPSCQVSVTLLATLAALLLVPPATAQNARPEGAIRLIVRGDDMGFSHTVNEACLAAYRDGIQTSVEVLVTGPWLPEAARMLREHPELDAGLHLTLTSEWENLKWRPLTAAPSLTDTAGYFYPMIWPNENYGDDRALKAQAWKLDEIEREWRAQIELAQREIPQLSHLSCHMGCTGLSEEVDALYRALSAEYGLAIHPGQLGVARATYDGPRRTPEEKERSFIRMLEQLKPGTYLFVDHPGYDTPELRAVYHTGYEDVAADRDGVTRLYTSTAVKAAIARLGIQLIRYKDL